MWITAKFDSQCRECELPIQKGDRVVYTPHDNKVYCGECGPDLEGQDAAAPRVIEKPVTELQKRTATSVANIARGLKLRIVGISYVSSI